MEFAGHLIIVKKYLFPNCFLSALLFFKGLFF